jgi:hypothetical protein
MGQWTLLPDALSRLSQVSWYMELKYASCESAFVVSDIHGNGL